MFRFCTVTDCDSLRALAFLNHAEVDDCAYTGSKDNHKIEYYIKYNVLYITIPANNMFMNQPNNSSQGERPWLCSLQQKQRYILTSVLTSI